MEKLDIPARYLAPAADSATAVLELVAAKRGSNLAGPHRLRQMVDLVVGEIERHKGPLGDDERSQWRNAVTSATDRLKDGNGCLEYHPPRQRGGHGVYMFKGVDQSSSTAVADDEGNDRESVAAGAYVYGWCLPHYQRDDDYPVKVGRTERSPQERAQDNLTNLPEDPKIIMEIPCRTPSDAEKTEMIFHHVLRMRGRSTRDRHRVGNEWFRTTVAELREIATFIYGDRLEADFPD